MSNGTHTVGTAARLGAGVISGALGAVRRVRLPQRDPEIERDAPRPTRSSPGGLLGRLQKLPRRPVLLALLALVVVVVGLLAVTAPTWAGTTFTVTNTNGSGTGSALPDEVERSPHHH